MTKLQNQINGEEVVKLCKKNEDTLSIIISSRSIADINQKLKVKLKNSIKTAKELIEAQGKESAKFIDQLSAVNIEQEIKNLPQTHSLIILVTAKSLNVFNTPRIIISTPIVSFGKKCLVRYFIRDLNLDKNYYLLDLSQKHTDLYEVDRFTIKNIDKKLGLPTGFQNMFLMERDSPRQQRSLGKGSSVFYGHSGGKDEHADVLNSYFHEIDSILLNKMPDKNKPIMLAGTEDIINKFLNITKYPNIWKAHIERSIDKIPESEILRLANKSLALQIELELNELVKTINDKVNTGKVLSDFAAIFDSAINGRVEYLIYKKGLSIWGQFSNGEITLKKQRGVNDIDLVNLLISTVLENSGKVYVDFGNVLQGDVLARLRY
ncbi:hypothetical protein KBD45_03130 [Candidatus Dojkabacteria bacterium]|nr:hypothetical protein [Candidatus Dojkabacteria bacterium]